MTYFATHSTHSEVNWRRIHHFRRLLETSRQELRKLLGQLWLVSSEIGLWLTSPSRFRKWCLSLDSSYSHPANIRKWALHLALNCLASSKSVILLAVCSGFLWNQMRLLFFLFHKFIQGDNEILLDFDFLFSVEQAMLTTKPILPFGLRCPSKPCPGSDCKKHRHAYTQRPTRLVHLCRKCPCFYRDKQDQCGC